MYLGSNYVVTMVWKGERKSAFRAENAKLCTHSVFSRKVAPVLNIILHVKMFADLSCFFYLDQGRHSCPGASCVLIDLCGLRGKNRGVT